MASLRSVTSPAADALATAVPPAAGGATSDPIVIEPRSNWQFVSMRECVEYRDLLYFLVLRDVTVLYKQTVFGMSWAILNPFFSMVVFTAIFGMLLKVPSDGLPYALFSFAALIPWTYFSQALGGATNSLISGTSLFTKVYFPRVFIPLVPVFSKLVDLVVALGFLGLMLMWYGVRPSYNVVFLPLLLVIMMLATAGFGMFLAAVAVQYRDVRHAMTFAIQILMYAAPVVWPASKIPADLRLWYGLYPMAGVIEGFRASLLNTGAMPWDLIGMGALTSVVAFIVGGLYFRRTERLFADVA